MDAQEKQETRKRIYERLFSARLLIDDLFRNDTEALDDTELKELDTIYELIEELEYQLDVE